MRPRDIPEVVALQLEAFPHPFDPGLLWGPEHLARHLSVCPALQFVAEAEGRIVGSCSNCILAEQAWREHKTWEDTVGGPFLERHDDSGTTLFGLDISVAPKARMQGIGRAFYGLRFAAVSDLELKRYGTASRIPDFAASNVSNPAEYVQRVVNGELEDRTLTPLLRYGLTCLGVAERFMCDSESGDAAAILEWLP